MVGMLQIITYLLCVYLIFKAVEIFQIALVSDGELRNPGRAIGILSIIATVALAAYFCNLIDAQAKAVSESMRFLPR